MVFSCKFVRCESLASGVRMRVAPSRLRGTAVAGGRNRNLSGITEGDRK